MFYIIHMVGILEVALTMLVLCLLITTVESNALTMSINDEVNVKLTIMQKLQRKILWLCYHRNLFGVDYLFVSNFILEKAILLVISVEQVYKYRIFIAEYSIDHRTRAICANSLNW
jgi:hypothetical protein